MIQLIIICMTVILVYGNYLLMPHFLCLVYSKISLGGLQLHTPEYKQSYIL